jgi:hypothetical protein
VNHNHRKHMLIMFACCMIPVTAFAAISIFNVYANNVLLFGMALLCPLLHLVMMNFMMGKPSHNHAPEQHLPKTKNLPTASTIDPQ